MGASARHFNAFKPASVSDYANTSPQSYASMGCGIPPQQNYKQPMDPSSPASGGQCDKPGQQEPAPQMGQSLFDKVSGGQMANINDPAPSGPAPWMSGGFGGMPLPQNFQPAVLNQIPQQGQAAALPNLLNAGGQTPEATGFMSNPIASNPGNPQGKPMTELDKQELLKKISAGQMAWL